MNPCSNNVYPTCLWNGTQVRDFIRDNMGPTLRDQKIKAQLWLGTLNDSRVANYAEPVLSDPAAASFITGAAYQWEGKDAIAETHRRWPTLKLMQSETECGKGANSFTDAEYTFSLIRKYFNGLVWFTKILTDPVHDIMLYHKAPLHLLRGETRKPHAHA